MNKFINEVFSKLADKKILVNFTVELIFFILKLVFCIFIYYVAIKVLKKLTPLFNIKKKDDLVVDKSLKSFIKSILNVGVHALLITICLLIMGVKESSLLAFFGTLGIGVGLALKDNLSNFAGGIIILLFKTYKVGDEVNISDEMGYIDDIDIFSTTIKTHNNDLVMIPNGMIISNKVINYTKTPIRRLKFIIGIAYDADIDVARKALEDLLRENPLVLKEPAVYSHVDSYGDSSINIALKGWTSNENYWTVYKETMNGIKKALDNVNVEIPFPQMDISIKNPKMDINLNKD
ncbi:mechanosensitive ion channel family protein [Fusobacterium mortiferum]|jgi:small conductance mechanosensitive channel|uniref:Mechanosensitive ion channel family protein n=2 Tax=Fusobacterium mortiferum TaxID=850 RepID=A0A414PTF3_FUSMR|nr:mechanosensitive ion channel family protein [Fusobacterium mortiferum]AVQ18612.1 mechanosensitive ion channel family protein [Fusobacterium mortiferum ATCC 9817]EEO34855.1 transporter, small conductance mechanosensitive ion channel MscS family protein [Fusobacterium mortiferum ATCC 9817]MCF2627540.1 mechanosensitive ion channel family protein [Fusobacterium mortiferum]MCI6381996.1 mechanosensitive ion channel family protein [Fusobacterium mortiferum]MDD7262199.1 mechanosensitive ion channel